MQTVEPYDHSLMSLSFVTLLLAIALFVSSLFFPVFITQTSDIHGYWVLAMGWLGFFSFQFAWYASPFTIIAIYVSKHSPQLGLLLSVIAILIASEAFLFSEVPFGQNDRVLDYGLGFYLWYLFFYLVSFSILLKLVAWGRIEEEAPEIDPYTMDSAESQIVEIQSNLPATIVTRVIIPKKEKAEKKKVDWERQTPPPLPKKSIYEGKENNKGSLAISPPPLPKQSLLNKAKSLPPPLSLPKPHLIDPTKKINYPPPLPEKKDLAIAPFLKKE